MNPRISWKRRHYFWVVIVIFVAVFVYFINHDKGDGTAIKDLTKKETSDEILGENYIDSMIEQCTEGPYPFVSVANNAGRIFVKYVKSTKEVSIELAGIKLPDETNPDYDAVKYLSEFLDEQFVRVEFEEIKGDSIKGYIYAYNKHVKAKNKTMINIALHLLAQGLVEVVNEAELEKSKHKDFLLGENDYAKLRKLGIYEDLKQPENEETEK